MTIAQDIQYAIDRAIAYAVRKNGVGETPNGSNHTEFWARMYPLANKPGYNWAWCACFGTDAYCTGAGVDFRPIVGWAYHCGYWRRAAQAAGAWRSKTSYAPQKGDVVIYGNDDHFGLIVASAGPGRINTIEGNTSPNSSGSQNDGGAVALKTRDTSWVSGYIDMHAYLAHLVGAGKVRLPVAPVGYVAGQAASRDYNRPPLVAGKLDLDGDFGPATIKALQSRLREFKASGADGKQLSVDGEYGKNTATALERVLNLKGRAKGYASLPITGATRPGGAKGTYVIRLQFFCGLPLADRDGDWGPLTTKALQSSLNAKKF